MILRSQLNCVEGMLQDPEDYEEFFTEVSNILWDRVKDLQDENKELKEEKEDLQKELETLKELYENLLENNADLNAENEKLLDITRNIEL